MITNRLQMTNEKECVCGGVLILSLPEDPSASAATVAAAAASAWIIY